jgi:hypothetical protein
MSASRRRRLAACGLPLVVLPLALAGAKAKPTMTAPATAAVGDTIEVTAKNLNRGRYTVRLYATKAPNNDWSCAATLATARKAGTAIRLSGEIPKRIGCYSGFPTSTEGSMKVTPGRYTIVVSVPNSQITVAAGSSVVQRRITIG